MGENYLKMSDKSQKSEDQDNSDLVRQPSDDILEVDRRDELSVERDNLESQLRAAEEEQQRRREAEALRENEIGRITKIHNLEKTEADELHQLLIEMRPLDFTHSKQLSTYITKHKLGNKYQNISGIVRMREGDTEWDFRGGFPPRIYKIICKELGLSNQGTPARPVGFKPFKDVY